jgi:hypothetical protein
MPEVRKLKPGAAVPAPKMTAKTTVPQTRTSKSSGGDGSLLSRITSLSEREGAGLHVSLYGRSKTGKTRLISTFPKPVVIIGAEDGTKSISNVEGVNFVRVLLKGTEPPEDGSFIYLEDFGTLVTELASSDYATVAVDTASALQDLVLCDIMGIPELPAQKSWGMASRDQYGQCALQTKEMLRKVLNLKQHVVITAHERNFNEEVSSELLIPSIGSALSPSITNWLNGAVDYICQTFIRERMVEKKTKVAGKEITTVQKSGKYDFCLRVGPHNVFMTGFRLPPGTELPEFIEDPSYEKIAAIANGEPAAE